MPLDNEVFAVTTWGQKDSLKIFPVHFGDAPFEKSSIFPYNQYKKHLQKVLQILLVRRAIFKRKGKNPKIFFDTIL